MGGNLRHRRSFLAVVTLVAAIGTTTTFMLAAAAQAATPAAVTADASGAAADTSATVPATNDPSATGNTGTAGNTGTSDGVTPTTTTPTTTPTTTTTTTTPAAPSKSSDGATGFAATPPDPGATGPAAPATNPTTAPDLHSSIATPNADPSSIVVGGTVTWTGNGTTNGFCGSLENLGVTVPTGDQAWLFILTSPGSGPFELTTNLGDVAGTQMGNGAVHFILITPLNAQLTSASAVTGTSNSVLTVSGCQLGAPGIATSISTVVDDGGTGMPWTGDEIVGATASDSSTVSPASVGAAPPSGTVTYKLFSNGSCSGPGAPQTVTLNSDGSVPNSPVTLPLAAGQYSYDAQYNGDSIYAPSLVGSCEIFSVAPTTPTMRTVVFDAKTNAPWTNTETAGATAFDTSTLSGLIVGFVPGGTVTYTFFPNGTCTAPGTAQTVTLAAGLVPPTATTLTLPAGNYSYEAIYNGDSNYNASAVSPCEPFAVAANSSSSTVVSTSTPTTPTPAAPAVIPTAAPSTPAAAASSGLAFTGANISAMFAAGLLLIGIGSALTLDSRRRRRRQRS